MQETLRTRRVGELIRQEAARVIRDEVHDPKVQDVVITAVKVSKDLDIARIFFTSYDKKNLRAIKSGLERSAGFIRREIIKAVRLKKTPRLEFIIDDAQNEAEKIDTLLDLLNDKDK